MADIDWDEFSAAVSYLKSGVNRLPFRDVILAATGHRILPFEQSSIEIVDVIKSWIHEHLDEISHYVETTYVGRPNELGNYLERYLINQLNTNLPFSCTTPRTAAGNLQAVGYPDGIIEAGSCILYFDVKTFQAKTKDTTLRSFYYQPTNQSKIHHDAPHFLIGFETKSLAGNNTSPFKIINITMVDIFNMNVNFKAEFNTNNRHLYTLKEL